MSETDLQSLTINEIKKITMTKKVETKEIDGVLTEFTFNKNGVKIKKCCASCKHHDPYDQDGPRRKCNPKDKIVDKSDCCGDWCISEQIDIIKLR